MSVAFITVDFKPRTRCPLTVGDYITRIKIKTMDKNFSPKSLEINWPTLEEVDERSLSEGEFDLPLNVVIERKIFQLREILEQVKFIFVKSSYEGKMLRNLLQFPDEANITLMQ